MQPREDVMEAFQQKHHFTTKKCATESPFKKLPQLGTTVYRHMPRKIHTNTNCTGALFT